MSLEKISELLDVAKKFYLKYFQEEFKESEYNDSKKEDYLNLSIEDIYTKLHRFLKNCDYDCDEFVFIPYRCEDYDFLEEYNTNVQEFFKTILFNSKESPLSFVDHSEYYFSLLSSIDDLIEVYECLYKNGFLLLKNFENDSLEYKNEYIFKPKLEKLKLKKLEEISKYLSSDFKNVTLNFIFLDINHEKIIPSVFLTDKYFRNSFQIQDCYTFIIDFNYDEIFLSEIFNYLLTGGISLNLDKTAIYNILEFADMYCFENLIKICSLFLSDDFFDKVLLKIEEDKKIVLTVRNIPYTIDVSDYFYKDLKLKCYTFDDLRYIIYENYLITYHNQYDLYNNDYGYNLHQYVWRNNDNDFENNDNSEKNDNSENNKLIFKNLETIYIPTCIKELFKKLNIIISKEYVDEFKQKYQ